MTFSNITAFHGLRVVPFTGELPTDPSTTMPRLSVDYEDGHLEEEVRKLLALPGVEQLRGLSLGLWGQPYEQAPRPALAALYDAADRLPNLTTFVFGDMGFEECEVSWITSDELGPLLNRFSRLEAVAVRGGQKLGLSHLNLPRLRTLVVQTGGLDGQVVRQLLDAKLPALERLELYLGAEDYGATATLADLAPIISGHTFPGLRHLALKNSELQDDLAIAITQSPLLSRLEILDLSMGILTDRGGRALLEEPRVRRLRHLDVSHHWMSEELVSRLEGLGIEEIDTSDRMGAADDDYKYVAIGE